jgi:hypothetical protein
MIEQKLKWKLIIKELARHAPFTSFGAVTGIIILMIVILKGIPSDVSHTLFYTLHPIHVILSAIVTTAIYKKYGKGKILIVILIGYFGSVGIATVSDSIIPYLGEILLNLPNPGIHLGFIEKWWLVNPLAFLGISFGYLKPLTKVPHAGHVLVSTYASLFHLTMAMGKTISWVLFLPIFLFLFLAVWLPCCLSDIIFPLLFVKAGKNNPQNVR